MRWEQDLVKDIRLGDYRDLRLKDNVNNFVAEWDGQQNLFYVDYSSIDNLEAI